MTAPDPGLTDLTAAHVLSGPYIEYDSDGHHADDFYRCGENCKWASNDDMVNRSAFAAHAAHVALVVEQHTNGRITELEDRIMRAIRELIDTRGRAEKAEATIARVRNALPNIEGINPASSHYDKGWDRGQQILTEHIQSAITGDYTRAAAEGES